MLNPLDPRPVEVNTDHPDLVHVRGSKNHGTGPTIAATHRQWAQLLGEVAQISPSHTA